MSLSLQIIVLGLLDFFTMIPFMVRMLLKPLQFLHYYITSDIPGNIHAFDNAVISLFRTLPEPSNFNLVHTRVPLPTIAEKDVLIVRGNFPPSRMHSLSAYGNQVEPPNSIEIFPIDDKNNEDSRRFEIELRRNCEISTTTSSSPSSTSVLELQDHWTHLMIVMRNYLVPPGTLVDTPEIIRKSDGKVIRTSQRLIAGPCTLDVTNFRFRNRLMVAAMYHCVILAWSTYPLSQSISTQDPHFMAHMISHGTIMTLGGFLLAWGLRLLMFFFGKLRLKQIPIAPLNCFGMAGLDKASSRSQPSKLHTYYFMQYAIDQNQELRISSKIDESRQKYWSLVVYDEYGIPLPQYVFDGNTNHKNRESSTRYEVDIRLRASTPSATSSSAGITYVELGNCTKGYIAFRLVHPKDDEIKLYSSPKAEVVSIDADNSKKMK